MDIYINIDGQGDVKYKNANGIVDLTPKSLETGIHTLTVAANYAQDEIRFKGLILDEGSKTVPLEKKRNHRIYRQFDYYRAAYNQRRSVCLCLAFRRIIRDQSYTDFLPWYYVGRWISL